MKRSYEHPNELREEFAHDSLQSAGMQPDHPDYQMFFRLVMRICENTRFSNSRRHTVGARLRELTAGGSISADQLGRIRQIADELCKWSSFPDNNALRAIDEAVKVRVKEKMAADAKRARLADVRPSFKSKFTEKDQRRIAKRAQSENNAALAQEVEISERTLARWKAKYFA